jgi:hypothetical protein
MPPVDAARLPAALLERFAGDAARQLIGFLSFLGPIPRGIDAGFLMNDAHPQRMHVGTRRRLIGSAGPR